MLRISWHYSFLIHLTLYRLQHYLNFCNGTSVITLEYIRTNTVDTGDTAKDGFVSALRDWFDYFERFLIYFIFSILRHCVRIDYGTTQFNFKCLRGVLPPKVNSTGVQNWFHTSRSADLHFHFLKSKLPRRLRCDLCWEVTISRLCPDRSFAWFFTGRPGKW
jgi:hypothetical protein